MEKVYKFLPFESIKKDIDWIYSNFDKIVISSRVRIARNIRGFPFPYNMNHHESKKIEEILTSLFFSSPFDKVFIVDISSLTDKERNILLEKHLISREFSENYTCGKVIIIPKKKATIMINEEDHLRIQSIFPGLNLKRCLKIVNEIDDYIGEKVEYAFLPHIGYLTTCLTNVGTGLRASVLMNIPGIKFLKRDKIIFKVIEKVGIAIRGFYGEGSLPFGSIYQISSTETTGKTEEEIVEELESVVKLLTDEEKKCIKEIEMDKNLRKKIFITLKNGLFTKREMDKNFGDFYSLLFLAYKTKILKIGREEFKNIFFTFLSKYEKKLIYLFYKNEGKILKRILMEKLNV
ncbi:MAG: ATP--guanido phosphotransferase [Candidatus Omnitrophica bacterium]|nr:ATP--guanido phosphotransferase [Candidatus Omnitrophota bacterium]